MIRRAAEHCQRSRAGIGRIRTVAKTIRLRIFASAVVCLIGNLIRTDEVQAVGEVARITAVGQAVVVVDAVKEYPSLFILALCVVIHAVLNIGSEEADNRHIFARNVEYEEIVQAVVAVETIIRHIRDVVRSDRHCSAFRRACVVRTAV